jgi:hypothetical protein
VVGGRCIFFSFCISSALQMSNSFENWVIQNNIRAFLNVILHPSLLDFLFTH